MDSNLMAASAAVFGSLLGAGASILTTWITQRTQSNRAEVEQKLRDRESLYGDFITEASRLTMEGLSHSLEHPDTFVKLYGIMGRIRLLATDRVLAAAEDCLHRIVDLYSKPNMTIDQIRVAFERGQLDPIKDFSTACRKELVEIAESS